LAAFRKYEQGERLILTNNEPGGRERCGGLADGRENTIYGRMCQLKAGDVKSFGSS
jgi:hypothetical protein